MDKINVVHPSMPPMSEFFKEVSDIWDSRWLTHTGPKHQKLEAQLKELWKISGVSVFSNGHQALEAAFSLLPTGAEVITTPFTFASTTLAIIRAGLVPVFCDIEPEFYTIDPEKIEALITEKTVAIAPVHVYGNLCNWRRIQEIADRRGLKVIYDAAHAFGVTEGDITVASLGDISMFSFHATKVFHTIEGGCLAYGSAELTRYFAAWRQFGMYDGIQSEFAGTNAKLTEFAAAMGLCNLRHLDEQISLRREAALHYCRRLTGRDGLILPHAQPGVTSNYAYFPIRVLPDRFGKNRNQVCEQLASQDIYTRKYFFPLTSAFPLVKERVPVQPTPVAEQMAEQILCLPMYGDLALSDVDRICDVILS